VKQIKCNYRGLDTFGIRCLTGEADKLHFRVLCDLTESGVVHLSEFFGGGIEFLCDNWNSGAVASVMLPRSILEDLALFCAIRNFNDVVKIVNCRGYESGVYYFEKDEEKATFLNSVSDEDSYIIYEGQKETRNVHVMSGRVQ
jgi:hypothetical protein